jgi:pimeloyl-ACP methyl ester carboxylesterase
MPALQDLQPGAVRPKRLIVMLPGIYDKASEFVSEGFIKDLRSRGIEADVVMPEAHFGYYELRDVDVRLEEDVFAPARARGYKEIWIVGVSLGGLGSLLYSGKYATADAPIAGIVLIAPFPGTDKVLAEVAQAGGLAAWSRTPQAQGGDERYALRWLVAASAAQDAKPLPGKATTPQIFMGTGKSDRLFQDQRFMRELLPPTRVTIVEGAHDWPTWRRIWQNFLDNGPWSLEAARQAHLDRIRL